MGRKIQQIIQSPRFAPPRFLLGFLLVFVNSCSPTPIQPQTEQNAPSITPPVAQLNPTNRFIPNNQPDSILGSDPESNKTNLDFPKVIRVGTGDSGEDLNLHQMIIQNFEMENPDVLVQMEAIAGTDYYARLMAILTANRAPDVVTLGDDFVPFFVDQSHFTSLEDLDSWKDYKREKYYPGLLDPGKVNGEQYFLPVSYSPLALYYNRRLFDESKIPYPTNNWTWNDLLGAAQKLTIDRDRDGIPEQWGIQMNANWESGFEYWVAAAGGRLISEDGKKFTGYMDSPESIRALRFYSDLYHKYRVAPPPADLQGWAGDNTEFINGTAAMLIFGYWPQEGFLKIPRIDLGVAPLPRDRVRANILFWEGGGITKSSDHPEESLDYLMYFTDNKSAGLWDGIELPITIQQSLSTSPSIDPFRTVWLGELQYLIPRTYTFTPYWEETGRYILKDALTIGISNSKADPANLLRQAALAAQTELDFYQK